MTARAVRTAIHGRAVAMAAVAAISLAAGCHSAPATKGPATAHAAVVKAELISVTRSLLSRTGIPFTGSAAMVWESCSGASTGPFRGTVSMTFAGKPSLADSERQVDAWIGKLHGHDWNTDQRVAPTSTRYLKGPNGFSATVSPHADPKVLLGADLIISSACVVTDDVGQEPGSDVTDQLR